MLAKRPSSYWVITKCGPGLEKADANLFLLGVLTADGPEKRQVRVPGQQKLSSGQEEEEPLPVLPLSEVPGGGNGQRR